MKEPTNEELLAILTLCFSEILKVPVDRLRIRSIQKMPMWQNAASLERGAITINGGLHND